MLGLTEHEFRRRYTWWQRIAIQTSALLEAFDLTPRTPLDEATRGGLAALERAPLLALYEQVDSNRFPEWGNAHLFRMPVDNFSYFKIWYSPVIALHKRGISTMDRLWALDESALEDLISGLPVLLIDGDGEAPTAEQIRES